MDNCFPKELRVVRGDDFTRVLRAGGCAADGTIVVFALPRTNFSPDQSHESLPTRLGVTIPKKTGKAVVRNQWKRWIRESFRTQRTKIPVGYDLIVRPKKDAVPDGSLIRKNLPRLAVKAINRIR
ncbi:ribonuclease P protein component [Neorhodopirellula pilleata]|uniref:Ribonuclease P protein component n=1 Tax=Neorhodopirellula pilleata TaxID=2714738 RepID=A0A5C6AAY1_9BACT|nr:ribonuclease P protein component [Neorhodopirellula pilleata]TWT95493.1 Ribonuclease P protein component [Neorhodopirellula pilleata]